MIIETGAVGGIALGISIGALRNGAATFVGAVFYPGVVKINISLCDPICTGCAEFL